MNGIDEHFVPGESILMFKAQTLARSRANTGKRNAPSIAAVRISQDDPSLAPIIELYEKHAGDIVNIFAELGDNPGKAIKYPPKDAKEFAVKVRCPCPLFNAALAIHLSLTVAALFPCSICAPKTLMTVRGGELHLHRLEGGDEEGGAGVQRGGE
jgi:hypothetical protein